MLAQFFQQQLDYIFFLDELALILLAVVCVFMRRQQERPLPLIWLGLFGLTQGIHKWLNLLTLCPEDGTVLPTVCLSVMTLSFCFLLEFGWDGWLCDCDGRRLSFHHPHSFPLPS